MVPVAVGDTLDADGLEMAVRVGREAAPHALNVSARAAETTTAEAARTRSFIRR
ncbi:hypothetical protein GCM10022286_05240 [Gryllotalpicola daejeonensis]|uniref:Uncharacterized protein n=1 Tax=Gryllotalpicola daejeonensis TaxID=993087 RepID=A0ABP7ZF02_9MICO